MPCPRLPHNLRLKEPGQDSTHAVQSGWAWTCRRMKASGWVNIHDRRSGFRRVAVAGVLQCVAACHSGHKICIAVCAVSQDSVSFSGLRDDAHVPVSSVSPIPTIGACGAALYKPADKPEPPSLLLFLRKR